MFQCLNRFAHSGEHYGWPYSFQLETNFITWLRLLPTRVLRYNFKGEAPYVLRIVGKNFPLIDWPSMRFMGIYQTLGIIAQIPNGKPWPCWFTFLLPYSMSDNDGDLSDIGVMVVVRNLLSCKRSLTPWSHIKIRVNTR